MKQFTYLFLLILCFSCSNRKKEMRYENANVVDNTEIVNSKGLTTYKYQEIATQKLQNYVELLKLKEKHLELKEDITAQLRRLSKETIINIQSNESIENIHQIGTIEIVSDTIQKIKLVYTLVSKNGKTKNFIYANINTTTIILDDIETTSNKITFSKD